MKVSCQECGEEFEALPLDRWTRRYCGKCVALIEAGQEAERQAESKERTERDQSQRIYQAKVPEIWKGITFDTSDSSIHKLAFTRCRKYAESFSPRQSGSLYLWSDGYGRGKTHLAACIANHVLHVRKYRVRFQKALALLLEIKHTYSDHSQGDESDILDSVLSFDLLILDDVGKGAASQWLTDTYWTVFDRRMEAGLPVVVTANIPLHNAGGGESLGDRIGFGAESRLRKMCGENVIEFKGKDLR